MDEYINKYINKRLDEIDNIIKTSSNHDYKNIEKHNNTTINRTIIKELEECRTFNKIDIILNELTNDIHKRTNIDITSIENIINKYENKIKNKYIELNIDYNNNQLKKKITESKYEQNIFDNLNKKDSLLFLSEKKHDIFSKFKIKKKCLVIIF